MSILLLPLRLSTNVAIADTKMMQYIISLIWCGPNYSSLTDANDLQSLNDNYRTYHETRHVMVLAL